MPAYCFSHFSKNWKNDISKVFTAKEDRLSVRAALTEITTIADPVALDRYVKAFIILLLSKYETPVLAAARRVIGQPDAPAGEEEREQVVIEDPYHKTLYKDSPFFQYFNNIAEKIKIDIKSVDGNLNKFFSPALAEKILKHYLPYLPLWTIFVARLHDPLVGRNNNARVERYFRKLKDACQDEEKLLTRLGGLKLGRYVEHQGRLNISLLNEVDVDKHSSRMSTNQPRMRKLSQSQPGPSRTVAESEKIEESSLSSQTEHWNKGRRSKYADYSRTCLFTAFGE